MQSAKQTEGLIRRHRLAGPDLGTVQGLVADVRRRFAGADDDLFLDRAASLAAALPHGLRDAIRATAVRDSAICVVGGWVVDPDLGPTPGHWNERRDARAGAGEDFLLVVLATLLGEPFAWATQQAGSLLHDIVPTRGCEHEQVGAGSAARLAWHTEDAFHPGRADYVGMTCLRNPDRVATTFARFASSALSAGWAGPLFEPRFVIRPDPSHLEHRQPASATSAAAAEITRMNARPAPVPVLTGARDSPDMCLDPAFMSAAPGDDVAARALRRMVEAVDREEVDVVLEPGDLCFFANHRVVHGRRAFRARYDGGDRWLKRVSIAAGPGTPGTQRAPR